MSVLKLFLVIGVAAFAACATGAGAIRDVQGQVQTTPSGLKSECLRTGSGKMAAHGDRVTVHYVGTLPDGSVFDSSRQRDKPLQFRLGEGRVIAGWDEGVVGMAVGSIRRLTVPPELGYGDEGVPGKIPPDTVLVFEVELLAVN